MFKAHYYNILYSFICTHLFPRNVIPGEAYHKDQVHLFDLVMVLPK